MGPGLGPADPNACRVVPPMTSNLKSFLATTAALCLFGAGCAAPTAPGTTTKPFSAVTDGKTPNNLDAPAASQVIFAVDIWVLSVPHKTLSGNEEFWKRIDEHAVDPATYDLLYRSGVRVGEAPKSELTLLDKYMDGPITKKKISVAAMEVKDMQVEMKKGVLEQDVFHLSQVNERIGRTYFDSDNMICISFEPARGKQRELRMKFCPMVRSTRSFLRATPLNQTYTITENTPEVLYDLKFRLDLSEDNFIIAMPSPDATRTDIGGAFFMKDGSTEKMEQVLIVMMKPYDVTIGKPLPN